MGRTTDHWEYDAHGRGVTVEAKRLWAGGAATAVVAAGAGLVGVLVIRGIMNVPVLTPSGDVQLFSGSGLTVPIVSAFAAIAATALLHALVLSAPRPQKFFSWIAGLVLAVVVLQVFLNNSPLLTTGEFGGLDDLVMQLATAGLYLLIGLAIISLLSGVGRTSITRRTPAPTRQDGYGARQHRYDPPGSWYHGDQPRDEGPTRPY